MLALTRRSCASPFWATLGLGLALGFPVGVSGQEAGLAASSSRPNATSFTSYDCGAKSAEDLADVLRPLLPKSPSVQLVVDREQNRILLSGPEDIHDLARRVLAEVTRPAPRRGESLGMNAGLVRPPTANAPSTAERAIAHFVAIPQPQFLHVERQFRAVFESRMVVRRVEGREILVLELGSAPPRRLDVEFDPVRGGALIGGPPDSVRQVSVLLQALGENPAGEGVRTRILRVHRSNHPSVRHIVDPVGMPPAPGGQLESPMGSMRRSRSEVAQAGYVEQDAGTQPVRQPPQGNPPPGADARGNPLRQFEGVEIESLPDLDVIILRGRDQDLEQLAEIIRQLERISKETQPEIHIHMLRHTSCEAIATILTQSNKDLVSGRAGRVTVTPLVKPNALLLIGWGDAVNAVFELIRQLDQPVDPRSQSAVFRLRHASAASTQQALNTFFATRAGLGPKVQTAIDNRTNTLIVYASPRDMTEVERLVQDLDRPDSAMVNRAHIVQIQNALATDVAQTLQQAILAGRGAADRSTVLELQVFDAEGQRILRSGTLENVQATPNARNNTIIVSSPPESLELILALIRQLDAPAAQVQIKVFQIVNGDAPSLIETLRSLIPSSTAGTVGPQLPSAPGETAMAPLRFSVDVRSNSIIATGSEGDLRIVEALLVKLDQSNTLQRKTTVYQLKNSPATDVAAAINEFLINRRRVENAAPGQDNPFQETEKEVVVVPEPVANKLVLAATPRYYDEISALIEKLDEQPPQVMIQVLIAEVTLGNTDELGVELGLQDSVLFDRSLLGDIVTTTTTETSSTPAGIVTTTQELIRSATNLPGFAFNSLQPLGNSGSASSLDSAGKTGSQGISNFSVGRNNDELGFGGLVLSASSRNVSVLIRALQESRRVEILSRPQVRTLDNQPAFIQVGQRVPRIIGSTVNQNGQSNSVALENVGLIIGVTPRVSPDGNVVMEIDAEKSQLGPETDGVPVAVSVDGTVIRSPRVDTTTAQATVSAADGETIVLGGLITNATQEFHRKVPWLGDVPIVGRLFRFDGTKARRTELLIILTPHVIRTHDDNERMRQTEMARMSWCAVDVFELQGDVGFHPASQAEMIERGQPEVVFPDENPGGEPFPADRVQPSPAPVPVVPMQ